MSVLPSLSSGSHAVVRLLTQAQMALFFFGFHISLFIYLVAVLPIRINIVCLVYFKMKWHKIVTVYAWQVDQCWDDFPPHL